MIASLRLRGLSQRQIVLALQDPERGYRNPRTGKPWGLATINADIQALDEQWRTNSSQDTAEFKARLMAELDELKRAAWKDKDHELVRRVIRDQRDMVGTDAPQTVKHTGTGKDGEIEFNVNDARDEIQRKLAGIAAAIGADGIPGQPDAD